MQPQTRRSEDTIRTITTMTIFGVPGGEQRRNQTLAWIAQNFSMSHGSVNVARSEPINISSRNVPSHTSYNHRKAWSTWTRVRQERSRGRMPLKPVPAQVRHLLYLHSTPKTRSTHLCQAAVVNVAHCFPPLAVRMLWNTDFC